MGYMIEPFRWTTTCRRCDAPLGAEEGDLHHPPGSEPYVICPLCTLYEGVDAGELPAVLSSYPRNVDGIDYSPYPFQAVDADWFASARAVLGNQEMGCGKTIVTIIGGFRSDWGNVLFVPGSVKWNWEREIWRWRSDLSPVVITRKKDWRLPQPGEVIIASYGMIPGEPCHACKATRRRACSHASGQVNPLPEINEPVVLVVDEVQSLQNKTARRRRWDQLKDAVWAAGGKLIGLTGTDVSNHPKDLWEILCLLNLERAAGWFSLEDFKADFAEWFGVPKYARHGPTGFLRDVILKRLRRVRVHRLRKHVLSHLPPVIERTLQVELNKKTLAELDEAVQRLLATRRSWGDVEAGVIDNPWGHALVERDGKDVRKKLSPDEKERRQLMFDDRVEMYFRTRPWVTDEELRDAVKEVLDNKGVTPAFEELAKVRRMLTLAKIPDVLEQVKRHEDAGEPLLVFCQHVDVLEEVFGGRPGWGLYTGRVNQKRRDETWTGFQAGDPAFQHGLGVSITSGDVGLNLTRAGSMLFIDEHYNPGRNKQAQARIQRPGAERHDVIQLYRMIADHKVDKMLQETLAQKLSLHDALKDEEASLSGLRLGAA